MKGAGWIKWTGLFLMIILLNENLSAQAVNAADSAVLDSDSSDTNSFLSTLEGNPSLRNDYGVASDSDTRQIPLGYQYIRPQDAIWGKRVWEEIDTRQKMNFSFNYPGHDEKGNSLTFINILLKAVLSGEVDAFDPINDRFTSKLTPEQVKETVVGKPKHQTITDLATGIERDTVIQSEFNPASVSFYRLKEDWIFDKQTSRLYCRIIGLAPIQTVYNEDGSVRGHKVLFWLYFPDLRPILSKYTVYNPKNFYQRMTWDDLFAMRYFSGHIIKEDNALDRSLKDIIPGDTKEDGIKRLLEGRKIHNQIRDYEQNLWVY